MIYTGAGVVLCKAVPLSSLSFLYRAAEREKETTYCGYWEFWKLPVPAMEMVPYSNYSYFQEN